MTVPICEEHAALLRTLAHKLKDTTARRVYADWLQERDCPAWYVVANYPPKGWYTVVKSRGVIKEGRYTFAHATEIVAHLPWLEGTVTVEGNTEPVRTKRLLLAYAAKK